MTREPKVKKPIITGKHLIEFGLIPGPQFKKILELCHGAQLDGEFSAVGTGRIFLSGLLRGAKL